MATIDIDTTTPETVAEALAGRLFEAGLQALELTTVRLGAELGLYAALHERGPSTPLELAAAAAIDGRYAREWLEQQATAGLVTVDDATLAADERRYTLPAGSEAVLLDPDSMAYTLPLAELPESVARVMPGLLRAYRTGAGVEYADYGFHDVQAAFNRPSFVNLLAAEWIPAIPDLHEQFREGARVAEFGCGEGWAAVSLARGYANVTVDGFDADDASIAAARRIAAEAGVADRVRFEVADVTRAEYAQTYDAVFCFEMLHDLARPVEALEAARRITGGTGTVIVMDERVGEVFTAPADPMERLFYAASVLHCLPVGRTEQPSAATGTVIRPDTVRRYAVEAGFTHVDVLPIEHDMFRFYRLRG